MSIEPAIFKFEGQEYKSCARAKQLLLGARSLGSCCVEWALIRSPNASGKSFGAKDKIRSNIIWSAAIETIAAELEGAIGTNFTTNDISVPTFEPKTIPGTSKGVKYNTLFVTEKGYVAYRQDEDLTAAARIRIAKKDITIPWPTLSLGNGKTWESVNSTHLAQQSHNGFEAKVLIARGLDALLKLDNC